MSTQYISRTYEDLWTSVELHVRLETETEDKDQKLAARLSALVFSFFTLEAYLNHLGTKAKPDLWEGRRERDYFGGRKEINGRKYFGPMGKLEFLYSECGLVYEKSSDDVQTIRRLKEFRDLLAHGNTEEDVLPITCPRGQEPDLIVPQVWQYVHSDLRELSYSCVKKVIERLHDAAASSFPEAGLEPVAFGCAFYQVTDVE